MMVDEETIGVQFELSDEQVRTLYARCEEILNQNLPYRAGAFCRIIGHFPTNLELTGFEKILRKMKKEKENGLHTEYPQDNT